MRDFGILAVGAGLGAGLAYMLDPDRGRRRRSLARDQVVHLLNKGDAVLGATARDVRNRGRGLVAEARQLMTNAGASDDVLAQRVRSKLGFYVSHPRAIQVQASNGRVTLQGLVLRSELYGLLAATHRVRGVHEVEHQLEVHEKPDAPALQDSSPRAGEHMELMQRTWSPAARLLVGAAGGVLLVTAGLRRSVATSVLGAIGLALAARAATNVDPIGLLEAAAERGAAASTSPGE